MNIENSFLDDISEIKAAINKNNRLVSLSGLSGIAAGITALIGAYFINSSFNEALLKLEEYRKALLLEKPTKLGLVLDFHKLNLYYTFSIVIMIAALSSFLFTYIRAKRLGLSIWHKSATKLFIEFSWPMILCGIFCITLIQKNYFDYLLAISLLLYGLILLYTSKWANKETKYLAIIMIVLSIFALWFNKLQIIFWAVGFGVCHIFYGAILWFKYEYKS